MTAGAERQPEPAADAAAFVRTSVLLRRLQDDAPEKHFTLGWLMTRLGERSYGMVMLLLSLAAIPPGISIVAGLLVMIPALQLIAGRPGPVFPHCIAVRPLSTRHLAALVQRAVPVLTYLEKFIHPRWPAPVEKAGRLVGTVIMLLSIVLVLAPIPLSNIVPALVIALISLAYLEEDGLALPIALLAALVALTVALLALWQAVLGAKWISGFR